MYGQKYMEQAWARKCDVPHKTDLAPMFLSQAYYSKYVYNFFFSKYFELILGIIVLNQGVKNNEYRDIIPCNHRLIIMKNLYLRLTERFWQIFGDLLFLKSYCSSHCFIQFPTQKVVSITVNTRFYKSKLDILVAMWIKTTNSQGFTSGTELFCVTRFCETITENYINETA